MSRYETRNGDYQENRFAGWTRAELRAYAAKRFTESERLKAYPSAEYWGRLLSDAWSRVLEIQDSQEAA